MGMSRLVAMISDGHTALDIASPMLPIRLYRFDDGYYVVGIAAANDWAMAKQVRSIGGLDMKALETKVAPLISHDNQAGLTLNVPNYMVMIDVLRYVGAMGKDGKAHFTVDDGKGGSKDLAVAPATGNIHWAKPTWPTPLRSKKRQLNYWNDYLAEHKAVYMKYNRCAEMKGTPFARFAAGMLAFIDQKKVERVIIDLRGNGGGNSMIFRPLLQGLAARKRLRGHIYVLVDRAVFSSALLNALELEQQVGATVIGEATSGKPNHHGEIKPFRLPHSGLRASYSTKFFRKIEKSDPPSLVPEVKTPIRMADVLAGKDAALEAALTRP
jgi:hypothetical protein